MDMFGDGLGGVNSCNLLCWSPLRGRHYFDFCWVELFH